MEASTIAIMLFLAGVGLVFAEILVPGFMLAVLGGVLMLYGVILLLAPWLLDVWWGPWLLAAMVIPFSGLSLYIYRLLSPPSRVEVSSYEGLVGRVGVVVEDVEPDSISGKVRVGSDIWSASSSGGRIPRGARVRVVGVEGVHLIVEPAEGEESDK